MARTKQTARKSTGGRAPRKICHKKPKRGPPDHPTIFDSRDVLEPYIKNYFKEHNVDITQAQFDYVWNIGISNRDKIIKVMSEARSKATNENSERSYDRAIKVMNRVQGPVLSHTQFESERGFGKTMLEIIRDVVEGKKFVSVDQDTIFVRNKKAYSVYSQEKGLFLISEDGQDIVHVTKRANGKYAEKGQRGKNIHYFEIKE